MSSRFRWAVPAAALVALVLSGCAPTVSLEAAPNANDPGCAEVITRLPDTASDQPRRTTDAQATAAYGDPATVLLHCGVPPVGPTTDECVNLSGVDWIRHPSPDDKGPFRFTTYGRVPAIEVVVDSTIENGVSGTTALLDLNSAVSVIPAERACLGVEDFLGNQ